MAMDVSVPLTQSNAVPAGERSRSSWTERDAESGERDSAPQGIEYERYRDAGMVSIVFADLNGDGKQDLVFSSPGEHAE